jgi:Gpi18-like mannosyltransferase
MDKKLDIFIPLLLFLFITLLLPSLPGMGYDIHNCWEPWALYIHQNGLKNAYGSDTDYMPVYQYILWAYVKISGTDKTIIENLRYISCATLLFDFLGLWYVAKWIDKKAAYFAVLLISILNLGYSYNTIIWGQIDGILSALVFISVYYAYKGNNLWAAVWLVLAFNLKIQTIIILPVWGLLFLNNIIANRSWKNIVLPVIAAAIVQVVLIIPFTLGNYGVRKIIYVIIHSFNKYHSVAVIEANIWHWLVPGNLLYTDDTKVWIAGLTYKQVGLALFFTSSFFALLPVILLIIKRWKTDNKRNLINKELIWVTSAMVYLLFYFFNTEIHERYCQPAFIFITAYTFFTGDFITYILFSLMYFLTLEYSMHHLRLENYETFIFDFRFLSSITALIIIMLAGKIYKNYKLCLSTSNSP